MRTDRSATLVWTLDAALCLALGLGCAGGDENPVGPGGGDGGATETQTVDEPDATDDGGDQQAVVGCVGETDRELCVRENKTCGTFSANDNCGDWRTVDDCSFGAGCASPQVCGACHRCCTEETDEEFCARLGLNCGNTYLQDSCSRVRPTASCGTCSNGETCGGSGMPNVCGCADGSDAGSCSNQLPGDAGSDGD
jgi:hypothetical protein